MSLQANEGFGSLEAREDTVDCDMLCYYPDFLPLYLNCLKNMQSTVSKGGRKVNRTDSLTIFLRGHIPAKSAAVM